MNFFSAHYAYACTFAPTASYAYAPFGGLQREDAEGPISSDLFSDMLDNPWLRIGSLGKFTGLGLTEIFGRPKPATGGL